MFEHELFRALEQIQTAPRSGARYVTRSGRDCRRVLMPRTQHFIYYRIVESGEVRVVAVWSGQRGQGPAL